MDEALEILDVLADSGLEGVLTWVLRLVGLLAILAGIGLLVATDLAAVPVPAGLVLVGIVLLVAPSVLLLAAELV